MTPDQIKISIEALRTTSYGQVRGRIKNGECNAFCCIGIMYLANFPKAGMPLSTVDAIVDLKLSQDLSKGFILDNDRYYLSFAEIADKLERGEYPA